MSSSTAGTSKRLKFDLSGDNWAYYSKEMYAVMQDWNRGFINRRQLSQRLRRLNDTKNQKEKIKRMINKGLI